ncbi:MAG: hypothetical protein HYS58_02970 [Elusimicrobia bacterium]|nr:hypothetical protein [Elusimicrobiota bacterium]
MSNLDSTDRRNDRLEIWNPTDVIPAKAGIQSRRYQEPWMPAFAGMTANLDSSGGG